MEKRDTSTTEEVQGSVIDPETELRRSTRFYSSYADVSYADIISLSKSYASEVQEELGSYQQAQGIFE